MILLFFNGILYSFTHIFLYALFSLYSFFYFNNYTNVNHACTYFSDKRDLRLYGLPDRSWELKVAEEDHCELENIPPPTIGIKLARPNNMQDNPWIPLIALHGDSWLLAVAFYYASKSGFDEADR